MHATPDHFAMLLAGALRRFHDIEDSFTKVNLNIRPKGELGEGRMEEERLTSVSQVSCDHAKQRRYTQRRFDILNGFELVLTRCINCHKILILEAKKLT